MLISVCGNLPPPFARMSAVSLPGVLQWDGIHKTVIIFWIYLKKTEIEEPGDTWRNSRKKNKKEAEIKISQWTGQVV